MGIPDYLTCLLRNLYAGQSATVRTGHGANGANQNWAGYKSRKEYVKAVYYYLAYLTFIHTHTHTHIYIYTQSTSGKMPGWMKHKLESRLPGEISITSYMQMTPPLWKKAKKN